LFFLAPVEVSDILVRITFSHHLPFPTLTSFQLFNMPFMPLGCELWRLVCRVFFLPLQPVLTALLLSDTGAEKKELCLSLGAEKWVDFRETKDLVKDIKNAAGGEGPHATLVSAASVSFFFCLTGACYIHDV
jgi:zinc-binding dehydrogenase